MKYTDQYLRRSFSLIQQNLAPDSVLFLGDLFDGGREWARGSYTSPEKRYRRYKDPYWKQEFGRFVSIFSEHFNDAVNGSSNPRGRKMLASLPGNHDLGFGVGVNEAVRERFQTFFGKSNRVDILGNHTFVSVDTVSLSAMDQPRARAGSGEEFDEGGLPNEWIWREAEDFLNNIAVHRVKAETEELRMLRNESEGVKFRYIVQDDISEPAVVEKPRPEVGGFPAVLLTHVPLYRKPGTPCGPLRERYPPSAEGELEEDEPNAIKVQSGYQYQNVLTPTISNDLVSKIGPSLIQVYSGDDHDYCELLHREFSNSPREITVKSLSWAMGVRRPGFVLASLWNPIDPTTGKPLDPHQAASTGTLQNQLCLLPNQLSIFIWYAGLFAFSLLVLFLRSIALAFPSRLYRHSSENFGKLPDPELSLASLHRSPTLPSPASSSTSSSTRSSPGRGLASRAMSTAPAPGASSRHGLSKEFSDTTAWYPELSPDRNDKYPAESDVKWRSRPQVGMASPARPSRRLDVLRREFLGGVVHVGLVVFAWYFYLIRAW